MTDLITVNAKAIAGFLTTLLVGWLTNVGLDIPEEVSIAITSLIVAFFVWLVRNKLKVVEVTQTVEISPPVGN